MGRRVRIGHTLSGVRVQRSEGSKGSEGGGGGFAADLKKGGAAGAAGCVEGLWKKVLRMDRPAAGGFLGLTGPAGPRVVDCRSAAMLIKSALRDWLSVSYGMKNNSADWLAALASPYPASPDFPLFRGQNKTPRNTLFINGSTVSTGYCATACGESSAKRARGGSRYTSGARLACFPRPQGGCMGFIQTGAFYNLEAPTTTLSGKAAVKLKNPRGDSPVKL